MRNSSGAEAKSARKLEKRLAKLEDMERKLLEIEDVMYKTKKSQIQMLTILNHSQMRQVDSFNAFQGVLTRFMGKVWSMAKAKLFDGQLEEDPYFDEEVKRTLEAEAERLSQAREHQAERERDLNNAGQENARMETQRTTRGQEPDNITEMEQSKDHTDLTEQPAGGIAQSGVPPEKQDPPPPTATKKAPRKTRGR